MRKLVESLGIEIFVFFCFIAGVGCITTGSVAETLLESINIYTAGAHPIKIGNPSLTQFPNNDPGDCLARSVWDMHYYNGSIYVGSGDLWNNRGLIDVWSFDASGIFKKEYRVDEEQVCIFRDYDGKLYIPGMDSTQSWDYGNLYIKDNGVWQKLRTIPSGIHVWSVAVLKGNIYVYKRGGGNYILESSDQGQTWDTVISADYESNRFFGSMIPFDDFLLIMGRTAEGEPCIYKYADGVLETLLLSGDPSVTVPSTGIVLTRFVRFGDGVLCAPHPVSARDFPLFFMSGFNNPEGLDITIINESYNGQVRDIIVRDTTCYILVDSEDATGHIGCIYSSSEIHPSGLSSWSMVAAFRLPASPYSLEFMNGVFYVGLGCREDGDNESGSIYKIDIYQEDDNRLNVMASCPVDLVITDPLGRTISNGDVAAIPDATYIEIDVNDDGDPDDSVMIPDGLVGNYSIEIVPEPDAQPTDTYTLTVSYIGGSVTLAEDAPVQSESHTFFFPQRRMEEDWNLFSLPVDPPDTSREAVLQSIDGKYTAIWGYSANPGWERYDVNGPAILNNLTHVVSGKGYWLKMSEAASLTLTGDPAGAPIALLETWNLVGFNHLTAMDLADALESIDGFYNAVWGYSGNPGWERYVVDGEPPLNDMVEFKTGRGYWIDADAGCPPWDVNGNGGLTAPPSLPVFAGARQRRISRPGIPYTIWGNVEVHGTKIADDVTVFVKVDNKVESSYKLGSRARYGENYVLDILTSNDDSAEVKIYVQMGDTVVEAGTLLPGNPGEIIRFDLSVDLSPRVSMLHQNYPNPFNPETWIPYQLKEESQVEIKIFALTGQLVRTLDLGLNPAGFYTRKAKAAYWDGRNESGERVASGVYFYSIKAGDLTAKRKMVVTR